MTKFQNIAIVIFSSLCFVHCENSRKPDSHEIAEEKNEETFDTRADEKEAAFVVDAIQQNLAEIKLAELASTKSSNKDVQAIAQKMVSDHANSNERLRNLASRKGITVPVEEGQAAREKVNALAKETQPDFDKKWCHELTRKHEKKIRDFESMLKKSEDVDLQDIIQTTLPNLREHLAKLTALEKNMI
jgi:putative membrane protein